MQNRSASGRRNTPPRKSRRLSSEPLEARCLLDGNHLNWNDTSQLSVSFAPDGTDIGGEPSALFEAFNQVATPREWKETILRAFQTWAMHTTINLGVVNDGGQPFGIAGPRTEDPRFGDIRIGARPLVGDVMALGVSQNAIVAGTWAGDVIFDSEEKFESLDEIFAVALHEAGHVFGVSHSDDAKSPMHSHAEPTVSELTPADIEAVRDRHGSRIDDIHEGPRNNNTLRTATSLRHPTPDGVASLPPVLIYGDLTTVDDIDYYAMTDFDRQGPVTVRLQSSEISLLAPRLRVVTGRGVEVGRSSSARPGSTLFVRIDEFDPDERYFIEVDAARNDLFAVGDYSLLVSFDAVPQIDQERVDVVTTGRIRELDQEQLQRLLSNEASLLNIDLNEDDTQEMANTLGSRRGFQADEHFATVASISNDRDIDYYRFVTPKNDAQKEVIIGLSLRSLRAADLIPQAKIFNTRNQEIDSEILVHGNGEFVLQARLRPGQHYFVRVEADDAQSPFRLGNYRLNLSVIDDWVEMEQFMAGQVGGDEPLAAHRLLVERPQLLHVAMDVGARPAANVGDQVVIARFQDSDGEILSQLSAPINATRTSHGLFMSPGEYFVRVFTTRLGDDQSRPVAFQLRGTTFADPFGVDPPDPTEDPIFQCPGQEDLYCYPGGIISEEPFLWDEFLETLPEVPDLELPELISALLGDWWHWYWSYVGENGPVLAFDDAYEANGGDALMVDKDHGVLDNDLDPEAGLMAAFLIDGPSHGALTLNNDGSFMYVPELGFEGLDEFIYVASDFVSNSQPALVQIEVIGGVVEGDLNNDQVVDGDDVELICEAIWLGSNDMIFDLTKDGEVNDDDLLYLVEDLLGTGVGDANLDGVFNSSDMIAIFQAGYYDNLDAGLATWATGDWNCDGEFNSSDIVRSFQQGNYSTAAVSAESLVMQDWRRPDVDQLDDEGESRRNRRQRRGSAWIA